MIGVLDASLGEVIPPELYGGLWGSQRRNETTVEGGLPRGVTLSARTAKLRISSMQRAVSNVIAQGPVGDRLGVHESMTQLEEHLKEEGHDTHMVVKITKQIGEWSVRETSKESAVLAQGNLEEKTEGNRSSELKKIEGSFHQDPSVQSSIRKSLRMWISRNAQTNGGRQIRSRSSVARRNNDESRSEQRKSQVTMSASLAKLACVFCTSSVLAGVDYFSFVRHGTVAPSPETYTKVCKWCASKVTTKESDESDSSSSTILNDS